MLDKRSNPDQIAHTSREDNSLRLPCQLSDLGGAWKQLGENTEGSEATENQMAGLRLQ